MADDKQLVGALKKLAADLFESREQIKELESGAREPVAIIGMGCRYPGGVTGPESFWDLLTAGTDAVGGFPTDRGWDAFEAEYGSAGPSSGEAYARQGAFVYDAADFDASFFGISPREALAMDPQQRLLLETAWEAIEHAALDPAGMQGSNTGVYVGANNSSYSTGLMGKDSSLDGYLLTGNVTAVASGRISYVLGLTGPAVTVDTACSSSLVALHQAVQALRAGECSMALAGGVAVMVTPGAFMEFSQQGGMAASGRCKAFSAEADGIGWGEGAGMLVLERLSDARRNGHQVLAVIRGTAANQDGASNGLTAPNGPSQRRVIRAALANAQLSAAEVDAVEAHGTGTTLGDPIEAGALLATYGQAEERSADRPLWLGSVKSNIGHAQCAGGVAGVIKMVLALRHGLLPKSLYAQEPTPHVDWSAGNVKLLQEPVEWAAGEQARRAGVSAFGVSGTNVHVILEEAPRNAPDEAKAPENVTPVLAPEVPVWVLAGRSAAGLAAQAGRLREHVLARPEVAPRDIAWSLATTRTAFEHRAVVLGAGREELTAGLAAVATAQPAANVVTGTVAPSGAGRAVFVFPGQGSQWVGMGRELAEVSPVFAARLGECAAALKPYVDWELEDVLAGRHGFEAADVVQPALWAVMVSLAAVWQAAGVQPDAVVGHSQGEIAAAAVAGILSLDDAAKVVALRSKTLTALAGRGGMMSIAEAADVVRERIAPFGERLSLAAVNGSSATVVSGEPEALRELADSCPESVRTRIIPVDYASHSAQVDDLREEILSVLDGIAPREASIPMISAMSGEVLTGPELDPAYWYASLRETVEFDRAVRVLAEKGHGTYIEVSPHPVLTTAIADSLEERSPVAVGTLRREDGGAERLLTSFAEAHTGGVVVDWAAVLGGSGVTVDLPTYAFQRRRFWPEALSSKPVGAAAGADDWRYRITWQPQADGVATLSGRWLVIGETPERDDIAGALMDRGAEVVVVTDPAGVGQVDAAGVAGVLSLLAFDESADAEYPWVPRGTAATLALVQELGRSGIDAPLWIVTRGAVETGAGEATTNPAQAQVWGLGRAVGLEHPDRWGGLIDLPPVFDARVGARLVAVLADGREDQVALRSSGVLLRRLVRAEARGPKARVWSPRGTVLLTGGTGSIGTVVAPWLAEQGVPRVVLTSRSGPSAPGVAALAAEVAAGGSAVEVLCCDTGVRDQVAGIVAHVGRTGPGLATVLHSANTPFLSRVEDTAPDGLALALSAKAAGASYLDEATADLDLDAFVMFSSISATWGSNDHGAYAAGNSYLDALAEDRRARGLPGTSIAWGVWNTRDWDAVDALMDHSPGRVTPHRLLRQGMNFLDTGRALETLGQILADDETFIAVANVEWEKFAPVFCAARPRPLLDTIPQVEAMRAADAAAAGAGQAATGSGQAEPANELAGQLAGLGAAKRQKAVEELVRSHAAAVLGHESAADVPSQLAFREVGFDSLTAVELRTRLNGATGVRLPATVVFDHPNPVALAEEIVRRLFGAEDVAAAPVASAANASEPLAIVGMACRYPGGVRTPDELWQLLASGGDAISGFPADRGWDVEGLFDADPDHPGTSYASEGGFLSGAADFDADFFGISPREALAMDPQQRLLLEICWEAIERAGIDPRSLSGSATGVFAGVAPSGYATVGGDMHGAEGHLITGNAMSVLSGRVSYTLGLNGPALTVDTACSSSLVAIHLAGQALRSGECSMALAGGVTVMADPGEFIGFSRQRALAADGRCKAFADGADGMGMAEGAGMVVLERLSDARRLGHPVLGVIRGTAVNQDGASNGLTAPNGPAQQRVIRAALADARLSAGDVDAVEAHGTGTELGDPIEAGALLATYGQERDGQQPLWLGSLKSNIGHSQQAAGVGGVIKMVLALQHGLLPRTLHAESPSPHVDWSAGHIELLQEAREWATGERVRRAGVSAFGISGTNAHVIVEEAPDAEVASEEATGGSVVGRSVWLVSGRSVVARAEQAGRLRGFVADRPGLSVGDVGWSLAVGRSGFEERAVVVGGSREELLAGLGVVAAGESGPGVVVGSVRGRCRVGFLFAGQGSQRVGMGRELYGSNAVFAGAFDEVCGLIEAELGIDLAGVVLGEEGVGVGVGGVGVDSTLFAQTGLFAVEVALVAMLRSFGVVPDVVAGHSVGEVAAAFVAGVLSLGDAVRLVSHRARLMEGLPGGGAMAAVEASEEEIGVEVGGVGLSLAAVNGPRSVVVSGDVGVVDALVGRWRARGRRARRLRVSHAFHSAWVDPVLGELGEVAAGLEYGVPSVPWVGALSGELVREPGAAYWVAQARGAVRFADAVVGLVGEGVDVFVEVGPDGVLSSMGSLVVPDGVFVPVLRGGVSAVDAVVSALARVWVAGVGVEWGSLLAGQRVELPTYAFQRKRYWPETTVRSVANSGSEAESEFWAAVEQGDLAGLAGELSVDDGVLREVLPALADWRRRQCADSEVADWRYRVTWEGLIEPAAARLSGTWALLHGSGHDPEPVRAALEGHGATVLLVDSETADRRELGALLNHAFDEVTDLTGLVALIAPGNARGAEQALGLVQALGGIGVDAPVWALTEGAVTTASGEPAPDPEQAQVWGLGRVAALEHPQRWGGLIDLPPDLDARAADRLAAVLSGGLGEDQVAIRRAGLLARRVSRAPLPRTGHTWTPSGSVLVTGGTGGIAQAVDRWLVERGARHLVLTSRRGPTAAGVAQLAADLAGQGASVDVIACDVAERPQVAAVLERIPELCGVIHAAGIGQMTAMEDLTLQDHAYVVSAKTAGARWLDELTAERPLEAYVVFSSISATWGSSMQPSYAAANAYLDALVEGRRARGLAATSLAWGVWGGAGMGAGSAAEQLGRAGLRRMAPELGVRAMAQAVDAKEGVVAVADVDWSAFAPTFTLRRPSTLMAGVPEARAALATPVPSETGTAAGGLAQRLAGLAVAERERLVVDLVRTEAAGALGHADTAAVEPERSFKDLGFESLTAVELRNRLQSATGLVLPATLAFDYPNALALAAFLRAEALGEGDTDEPGAALADLDRLERRLADTAGDDGGTGLHEEMLRRLRGILSRYDEPEAAESADGDVKFDSATPDEVFDFLDKELGSA